MPHLRRALPLEQWPEGDRAAWHVAIADADPLDEPGLAAHWRPKVQHLVMDRHGFWLTCLRDREHAAEPSRDKRVRVVSPALLVDAAITELTRLQKLQEQRPSRRTAGRFRDALIIAFLATRPLRLANLTAIEGGKHMTKEGTVYWCRFAGPETKEGQPLDFPMPKELTIWLDHYLAVHRPLLLRGGNSNKQWISTRSKPMVDNTVYCRVTHTTKQLIGKPINPHLFRDCVATFIAEQMPEEVKIIARILGHATLATAEDYYNHASMLSAQARYLEALARLRQGGEPGYPHEQRSP